MIILDTHTLVWWVNHSPALPAIIRRRIARDLKRQQVGVCAISLWEIAMLYQRERLRLTYDLDTWVDMVSAIPGVEIYPLDYETLIASTVLPDFPHKDSADRMIVALTMQLGATLITKDEVLLQYPPVQARWR